ncbi:hypothetical protein L1987_66835 [Smallanthus sonchifolius]|uniref:Uncharacterized protein n=1 Tax=Smallanthus sonchifolius TaxID=185202 RepID=A0ACB9BYE3_9ASTR|nr:hypothetical protein L1987_66835 [Smallanthus sonchifolius]
MKPVPRLPQVVSYVTVECVTDTWVDRDVLGCTDEEIMMNMEKDTCPGFISDGQDRVVWMNKAYRLMVGEDDVAVVLVRKDKWSRSAVTYPGFTCKVRVTFGGPTLTLPCDVWRMEIGTFAWRLDVKAALSLGRCTNRDVLGLETTVYSDTSRSNHHNNKLVIFVGEVEASLSLVSSSHSQPMIKRSYNSSSGIIKRWHAVLYEVAADRGCMASRTHVYEVHIWGIGSPVRGDPYADEYTAMSQTKRDPGVVDIMAHGVGS